MTTLLERPKGRASAGTALSGTLPQVNLLPPEVRAARGLRATKRWLAISLIVTVIACIGVFGLALVSSAQADAELAEAQAETTRLQEAQAQYAEVPVVLAALASATDARTIGMSTDVQWKSYVDAIAAVLPANVSFDSMTLTAATPMIPAPAPIDPLQLPSVGQIQFEARTSVVPDTSAWIDSLNSVPGLRDAWVSSATVTEDESGIYYTVSATVQVSDAAYSHRFDPIEGEG